ncbi:MAG: cupin domain-containing protein [Pseudomonadales bacterium]|nr:cupin domain-containing protein [Pseudomonadales bacterium]
MIETLPPGSRSSIKHWHAEEDELVLALEGEVTLVEGAESHVLYPGDAATFRAGVPAGHCLENRSTEPCRYLVVGTRAAQEVATYPDHDRIAIMRTDSDETVWTDLRHAPADDPYRRAYDERG